METRNLIPASSNIMQNQDISCMHLKNTKLRSPRNTRPPATKTLLPFQAIKNTGTKDSQVNIHFQPSIIEHSMQHSQNKIFILAPPANNFSMLILHYQQYTQKSHLPIFQIYFYATTLHCSKFFMQYHKFYTKKFPFHNSSQVLLSIIVQTTKR